MKKLLLPTLAITSLMLGAACDMNKKTTRSTTVGDDPGFTTSRVNPVNPDVSDSSYSNTSNTTDEVSTSASSTATYGDSAGSAAAGNATYNNPDTSKDVKSGAAGGAVINNNNKSTATERSSQEDVSRPLLIEREEIILVEEPDYSEFERQSMEESESQSYLGVSDNQLDNLEDENAIFYGNPGASGSSGAPGTREIEDLND